MGLFSDAYDLSKYGNNGLGGSLETQPADGTPNTSSGGWFGLLNETLKTGVNGYVAIRQAQALGSQPETTYEQRVVPDNNLLQTMQQAGVGGVPGWALALGGVAVLIGVVLLMKD